MQELLERATISAVNLTETIHKLVGKGSADGLVERLLQGLQLNVADWFEGLAYSSGELANLGRAHGLSLGDRACLTLAKQLHATAVTSKSRLAASPWVGSEDTDVPLKASAPLRSRLGSAFVIFLRFRTLNQGAH